MRHFSTAVLLKWKWLFPENLVMSRCVFIITSGMVLSLVDKCLQATMFKHFTLHGTVLLNNDHLEL